VASLLAQRVDANPAAAFRVRPARRGDAESIGGLLKLLGYPEGTDAATVNWVISHPEIELFVAADGQDRPIAVVALSHRPQLRLKGRVLTIDELVVAEAWRRKGVGRALIARVIERARSLSAKQVEIATHPSEPAASLAFFEACGFSLSDARLARRR
jgi:N-acetylglutamate synthase-like GNAT family acetyltransferase